MDINSLWTRYYAQLGWVIGSVILAVICIRLLLNKRTGHRRAVMIWLQFSGATLVKSFAVAIDIYYHGRSTETWMFVVNAISFLWAAGYTMANYADLEITMTRTETAFILETEAKIAGETTDNFNRYLNEASRETTKAALEQQKSTFAMQG